MASAPTIDLDAWLVPIPGDNPSGRSLAYEPEYDAIREARRADDDTPQGEWKREVKSADWAAVVALGGACLRTRSKDLQIAAWVTEALARMHGYAGLRDGFRLLHGVQENFWETYYPVIDDGDLDSRSGPFVFLNDPRLLPHLIRTVPLTRGLGEEAYSFEKYRESRDTDNALKKNPEKEKALRAERKITGKQFDDQVKQTPRAFYEALCGDLREASEALRAFAAGTDERFGRDAPSLLNVEKALDECLRLLEPILNTKRQEEPDPAPPVAVDAPASAEAEADAAAGPAAAEGGAAPAPTADGVDFGRVLIDFRALAERLAGAGAKLEENRKRHAQLREEMNALDAEYQEISRLIGRDGESHRLLSRIIQLHGRG